MKRAIALPAYRDVQEFEMPEGVTRVSIDPETLQLATPQCPVTREEVYIIGTEPTEFCVLHGGRIASDAAPGSWLSRVFGGDKDKSQDAAQPLPPGATASTNKNGAPGASAETQQEPDENKKGVFRRIFGIFGGKKDADKPQQ
jgi:membrane carboxypeptidase/penicillin-binding protein